MTKTSEWLGGDAFAESRVLVTGGANGIGAALVELIAAHGGLVAILDREASESGGDANRRFFQADVTKIAEVNQAVADAALWMGGIDMVANVAGISRVFAVARPYRRAKAINARERVEGGSP